jgi:hypothetical protein
MNDKMMDKFITLCKSTADKYPQLSNDVMAVFDSTMDAIEMSDSGDGGFSEIEEAIFEIENLITGLKSARG